MIKSIYVKNFVLIDELNVECPSDFSCFTGETGAGKSLLIDAISILCGGRVSSNHIQKGAQKAFIEALIEIEDLTHPAFQLLHDNGYDIENGLFTLSREFTVEGKSAAKINQRSTTLSFIKDVMSGLVDIHSQHDTQYLLNAKYHLSLLDAYVNDDKHLHVVNGLFKAYQNILKEKDIFVTKDANVDDLEYFQFQLKEIEALDIQPNEWDELTLTIHEMSTYEKTSAALQAAITTLEECGYERIYDATKSLQELDIPVVLGCKEELLSAYYGIQEQKEKLSSYTSTMEFDAQEFDALQERLFEIKKLIRKHGNTYEDMCHSSDVIRQKIYAIEHRQTHLEELEKRIEKAYDEFYVEAQKRSEVRRSKARSLTQDIELELRELQLPNAMFNVSFIPCIHSSGIDKVEFLISMNPGEDLKPLSKVASGGELSRLMLGLKSIFSSLAHIETIIFDEIDNGVSGSVAHSIGQKMKQLAAKSQVFSVTHLAPVAAWADTHYLVKKTISDGQTTTDIRELDKRERVSELALIATGNDSDSSQLAALELFDSIHS